VVSIHSSPECGSAYSTTGFSFNSGNLFILIAFDVTKILLRIIANAEKTGRS
jgi:hypothetical protein